MSLSVKELETLSNSMIADLIAAQGGVISCAVADLNVDTTSLRKIPSADWAFYLHVESKRPEARAIVVASPRSKDTYGLAGSAIRKYMKSLNLTDAQIKGFLSSRTRSRHLVLPQVAEIINGSTALLELYLAYPSVVKLVKEPTTTRDRFYAWRHLVKTTMQHEATNQDYLMDAICELLRDMGAASTTLTEETILGLDTLLAKIEIERATKRSRGARTQIPKEYTPRSAPKNHAFDHLGDDLGYKPKKTPKRFNKKRK